MKKLLFIISIFLMSSCGNEVKPDPKVHYIDMDCVIVEKIPTAGTGRRTSKAFLIRGVKDTTLYNEYIDLYRYTMSDSVYYLHEVGDTLHFDYIRKSRFFGK